MKGEWVKRCEGMRGRNGTVVMGQVLEGYDAGDGGDQRRGRGGVGRGERGEVTMYWDAWGIQEGRKRCHEVGSDKG